MNESDPTDSAVSSSWSVRRRGGQRFAGGGGGGCCGVCCPPLPCAHGRTTRNENQQHCHAERYSLCLVDRLVFTIEPQHFVASLDSLDAKDTSRTGHELSLVLSTELWWGRGLRGELEICTWVADHFHALEENGLT